MNKTIIASLLAATVLLAANIAQAADKSEKPFITVASTTSTEASGLFKQLLPKFTAKTGIDVRVIAVGTGQAIRIARSGDADVLFVHHRPSEEKFVAEGYGLKRYDVMYNDFVIVGPKSDPAQIRGVKDAATAMKRVADKTSLFASRGDDSGTHKRERALWKTAGVDVKAASGSWYAERPRHLDQLREQGHA
jgi:tungstate transport system substrate-binding protein